MAEIARDESGELGALVGSGIPQNACNWVPTGSQTEADRPEMMTVEVEGEQVQVSCEALDPERGFVPEEEQNQDWVYTLGSYDSPASPHSSTARLWRTTRVGVPRVLDGLLPVDRDARCRRPARRSGRRHGPGPQHLQLDDRQRIGPQSRHPAHRHRCPLVRRQCTLHRRRSAAAQRRAHLCGRRLPVPAAVPRHGGQWAVLPGTARAGSPTAPARPPATTRRSPRPAASSPRRARTPTTTPTSCPVPSCSRRAARTATTQRAPSSIRPPRSCRRQRWSGPPPGCVRTTAPLRPPPASPAGRPRARRDVSCSSRPAPTPRTSPGS